MAGRKKLIFTPPVTISDKITIQRRGRYLVVWNEEGYKPKLKVSLPRIKTRLFEHSNGKILEERLYIIKSWEPYEEVTKEKS